MQKGDPRLIGELQKFFKAINSREQEDFINSNITYEVADLRLALADLYPESTRFEVGEMCDASECLDEILTQIGQSLEKSKRIEKKKFLNMVGFELQKVYVCGCKKRNDF